MSEDDKEFGQSPTVAKYAISMVVLSRIGMASPGMMIPPIFMNALEKKGENICTVHLIILSLP